MQKIMEPPECEFNRERAERFFSAMSACPDARDAELQKLCELLERLGIRKCGVIADFGAGHGYATLRMVEFLRADGMIYAIDNSADMLARIPHHRQVRPVVSRFDCLQIEDCSVDLAVTLATFHHIINKNRVLEEIHRILRPGGCFVVADVYDGTPVQRFFDDIVRTHCITGHDADFLNTEWVQMIARRANMECVSSRVEETPWKFRDEAESRAFFKQLFSLRLSLGDMDTVLRNTLGDHVVDRHGNVLVPWTLGYHALRKPMSP
jgi:ubiquinone/menaquinone biosynthesis C-methylase UbiE